MQVARLARAAIVSSGVGIAALMLAQRLPASTVMLGLIAPALGAGLSIAVIVGGRNGRGPLFQILSGALYVVVASLLVWFEVAQLRAGDVQPTLGTIVFGVHGEGLLAVFG